MSSLALHKQLLIQESELNRAQLVQELTTLATGVRAVREQTKSLGSFASLAAMVLAIGTAIHRRKSSVAPVKSSRWQLLLKGVGLVSTIVLALRSRSNGLAQKNTPLRG